MAQVQFLSCPSNLEWSSVCFTSLSGSIRLSVGSC